MNTLTLYYSTHRLETLRLSAGIMNSHDVVILEEPPHDAFRDMLRGNVDLKEHLLELDLEYPRFTAVQYKLLKRCFRFGKEIRQIEPYLEHLSNIHVFFAAGHSPEEIEPSTIESTVYKSERHATEKLLRYYNAARGDDFRRILSTMNEFAQADAARFVLRDTLRAECIATTLVQGKTACIEAGSMHLLLYRLLAQHLAKKWNIRVRFIDKMVVRSLKGKGTLYSPGDILTVDYILGRKVAKVRWQLLCAQSLIYQKIIEKEEICGGSKLYPHARNELEAIAAVKKFSLDDCRLLFPRIRSLSSSDAKSIVLDYLKDRKTA